jgi:hypothetical protein
MSAEAPHSSLQRVIGRSRLLCCVTLTAGMVPAARGGVNRKIRHDMADVNLKCGKAHLLAVPRGTPQSPAHANECVEQRRCVFEIGRVEAFGEPAVDRRASAWRPWSRRSRARLAMARNSQSLAPAPRPLQSDKGLSSIRLAKALGVPQSSAPPSGERCAAPALAASSSNPPSLPLVDKSGVRF